MSRVSETLFAIEETKNDLIGELKKPVIIIIPLLEQIAISLASIADSMKKEDKK